MINAAILIVLILIAALLLGILIILFKQISALEQYQESVEFGTEQILSATNRRQEPSYRPYQSPLSYTQRQDSHRMVYIGPQQNMEPHPTSLAGSPQHPHESGYLPAISFPQLTPGMQGQLPPTPAHPIHPQHHPQQHHPQHPVQPLPPRPAPLQLPSHHPGQRYVAPQASPSGQYPMPIATPQGIPQTDIQLLEQRDKTQKSLPGADDARRSRTEGHQDIKTAAQPLALPDAFSFLEPGPGERTLKTPKTAPTPPETTQTTAPEAQHAAPIAQPEPTSQPKQTSTPVPTTAPETTNVEPTPQPTQTTQAPVPANIQVNAAMTSGNPGATATLPATTAAPIAPPTVGTHTPDTPPRKETQPTPEIPGTSIEPPQATSPLADELTQALNAAIDNVELPLPPKVVLPKPTKEATGESPTITLEEQQKALQPGWDVQTVPPNQPINTVDPEELAPQPKPNTPPPESVASSITQPETTETTSQDTTGTTESNDSYRPETITPELDRLFRATSSYPTAVQVFRSKTESKPNPLLQAQVETAAPTEEQPTLPPTDEPAHSLPAENIEEALSRAKEFLEDETDLISGLQFVMGMALNQVEAADGAILQYVDETDEPRSLRFVATFGEAFEQLEHTTIPSDTGMLGYCLEERAGLLIDDASLEPSFQEGKLAEVGASEGSFLCVPLQHEEQLQGVFVLRNPPSDEAFALGELHILTYIAHATSAYIAKNTN